MSVNWRATIGYGVPVNMDEVSQAVGEYDDLSQDFDSVLELRYPLLRVGYAGNAFTGEGTERYVFIKESIVHCRDWETTFDINRLNSSMNAEGIEQLWKYLNDTGASNVDVTWRFLIDCG